MRFINSIYDLGYYTHPSSSGIPCYCEALLNASDLILQGRMSSSFESDYVASIYVYSADGLTQLEDATTYFDIYYFKFNGSIYFNLKLKTYSPEMCSNKCWILRVKIDNGANTYFDKYTDRYCQTTCCDSDKTVRIEQNGDNANTTINIPVVSDDCGNDYITLHTEYRCFNSINGEFYGIPDNVIQGDGYFSFTKRFNFIGRIVQRPREISRTLSYNCIVQRSESVIPYVVEQTNPNFLPTWKMNEVENMLHAEIIYINNVQFQFPSSAAFIQPDECFELFRLVTEFTSCTIRQTFGCTVDCTSTKTYYYVVPESYRGGQFYDENKLVIATDETQLKDYYRAQNGVISVQDESYPNTSFAFSVTYSNYAPPSFYFDSVSQTNRVIGSSIPNYPVVQCVTPNYGAAYSELMVCVTPNYGSEYSELTTVEEFDIIDTTNWTNTASKAYYSSFDDLVTLYISSEYAYGLDPTEDYVISNEKIGVIPFGSARPQSLVALTNEDSTDIPEGDTLLVYPNGDLIYFGEVTGVATLTITINSVSFYGS